MQQKLLEAVMQNDHRVEKEQYVDYLGTFAGEVLRLCRWCNIDRKSHRRSSYTILRTSGSCMQAGSPRARADFIGHKKTAPCWRLRLLRRRADVVDTFYFQKFLVLAIKQAPETN